MVASTSADPSSSRHNDVAFAVARSGIGKTLALLIAWRIGREGKPTFPWRRRSSVQSQRSRPEFAALGVALSLAPAPAEPLS